jgi:hypothetical protein
MSLTSAADGGWPLYPRERDPEPIVQDAEWAPEPVWTGAENLAPLCTYLPIGQTHTQYHQTKKGTLEK